MQTFLVTYHKKKIQGSSAAVASKKAVLKIFFAIFMKTSARESFIEIKWQSFKFIVGFI